MKEILKLTYKLFVITLVAGVLLGVTYSITEQPIQEQEIQKATQARRQVLSAETFEAMDVSAIQANQEYAQITDVYLGKDAGGKTVGAAIQMTAKGYKPGIVLTVGIAANGTVSGVNIGTHEETAGLGAKAELPEFYEQYAGKPADGSLSVMKNAAAGEDEILSIAGATVTSRGITDAVNTAANCYREYIQGQEGGSDE